MTKPAHSVRVTFARLADFVRYVAGGFPAFYVTLGLTGCVLILEYAATSLMIPLSQSAQDSKSRVVQFWADVLHRIGMVPEPRAWLWLFFIVMSARLLVGYLQIVSTAALGKAVHRTLSARIFAHVVRDEPLTAVYARTVGHYITLAGDDTFRCGMIISNLLQCCVTASTALVAVVILYAFSAPLFAALVVFMVVCGAGILLLFRNILAVNARANLLSRELNTAFVEAINSLRSIRALHAERFVTTSYADQIVRYVRMLFKIDALRAAIRSFPAVLLLALATVLLRQGSGLSISEATLLAVTIIVIRIFTALGQFITAGSVLLTDIRAVHDINALISVPHAEPDAPSMSSPSRVERVVLRDIVFGYGERVRILAGFSYRFEQGRTYAVVGPSGSGKSTLADILLGLVPPQSGAVIVNGGHSLRSVRSRLMLVEQQPKIFSSTLRDNLLFGAQASDELLWDALRLVDLDAAVQSMRDGLETVLSYQGENFSGGQRQRIGIARALVRQPDLLILDEATSALDAATRTLVLQNVRDRMRQGILILITHDPTLQNLADEVIDFRTLRDLPVFECVGS